MCSHFYFHLHRTITFACIENHFPFHFYGIVIISPLIISPLIISPPPSPFSPVKSHWCRPQEPSHTLLYSFSTHCLTLSLCVPASSYTTSHPIQQSSTNIHFRSQLTTTIHNHTQNPFMHHALFCPFTHISHCHRPSSPAFCLHWWVGKRLNEQSTAPTNLLPKPPA